MVELTTYAYNAAGQPSIANGGRINTTQVAADAFGNALGGSLAAASVSGADAGSSDYDYSNAPDESSAETARLNGYETQASQNDGFSMAAEQRLQTGQTISDAYGSVNSFEPTADALSLGRGPVSIGQSGRTVFINDASSLSDSGLIAKAQALTASGPSAFSYSAGSGNDVAGLEALDAQAASGSGVYLGADGGLYDTPQPPVVITGNRAELLAQLDAEQTNAGMDNGSLTPIGPVESFLTFTTPGRILSGVGQGVANMASGVVGLGKQLVLTASDAVGVGLYGLENAAGGTNRNYPLQSALGQSLQSQGFGQTALNLVGGIVQGTVGSVVAPFRAAYFQDANGFGQSLPGLAATALPFVKGGAIAEAAGIEALGYTGVGGVPINGATRNVPLGFESESQFLDAAQQLQDAMRANGITDATVGVRGSSVSGFGGNPRSPTFGQPFGPSSDIDLLVQSDQAVGQFKNQPNFLHPDKVIDAFPNLEDWSQTWSDILGRPVSPAIWKPGALPPTPANLVKGTNP